MSRTFDWLGGFVLGAAVMSLADPLSVRRRRVFLRGKAVRAFHETTDFLDRAARDLRRVSQQFPRIPTWSPGIQLLAGVGGLLLVTSGALLLARARRGSTRNMPHYASLVA